MNLSTLCADISLLVIRGAWPGRKKARFAELAECRSISLRKGLIMSRRTILSLVASVIIGIGFVGTISTDASAYYRRGVGVYRGGVYRGGVYRGYRVVRPGVAVGVGAAAVGAAALGAAAAGAYYAPGYYAPRYAPACGYYPYPPCY
jgi:hypothetical protein